MRTGTRLMLANKIAAVGIAVAALALAACSGGSAPTYPKVDKITAGALLEPDEFQGKSAEPIRAVTDTGLVMLKGVEGEIACKPQTAEKMHCPYDDFSDYCTIGHGHLIAKASCASITDQLKQLGFQYGISDAKADELLRADLGTSQLGLERQLDTAGKVGLTELTDAQYDALVSFIFNVGNKNFEGSTLLKKLKARTDTSGDVDVAEQFLRWNKSNGKFVDGLVTRRKKEVDRFFTGYEVPVTGKSASDDDGIDIKTGERP